MTKNNTSNPKKRTDEQKQKHRLYMQQWRLNRKQSTIKPLERPQGQNNSQSLKRKRKTLPSNSNTNSTNSILTNSTRKIKKTKPKNRKKVANKIKVSVGSFKPKNVVLSKLSKDSYSKYRSLYMRSYRIRLKIKELNKSKPNGYRTQRSALYKSLVEVNKESKAFFKGLGGVYDKVKKVDNEFNAETNTLTFVDTVWKFENRLRDYLKLGKFMYYNFVNLGKTYNFKIHLVSTILMAWDDVLDAAYEVGCTTPMVNVYEDYNKSKLTVVVVY